MQNSRLVQLACLVLPVALATACGGDKGTTTPATSQLAKLAIAQPLDTLSELMSRQLGVTGTDQDGKPMTAPNLAWTSSDTTVLFVTTAGLVTARQPGNAMLTVGSGSISATLALRVVPVPIADIPSRFIGGVSADTLLVGTSATLVAEPRDIGGRPMLGRKVTFAVSDTTRGTVDAAGRVTGRSVGPLTVIARVDTVERRSTLIVRPAFAARIAVRLADPKQLKDTLWVGLKDSAIVAFADADGTTLAPSPFRPVSYSTDNAQVAVVDAAGRVLPTGPGTTTLRATGDKLVAATSLRVVMAPITTIVAAPDTVRVLAGESTQIRPVLIDGGAQRIASLTGHTLRFDALTPGVATVDAQGVVRGVATGQGSVRITSDRGTAVVPVRVLSPAGDQAFRITVKFIGPKPSKDVQDAFAAATARWEGVIRETIGTTVYPITPNTCGSDEPAHDESVRDVLIYARIDSIDGPNNILGQAGPCIIKKLATGRWLPTIGRMAFDSADMQLMATTGRLVNVITHEMGHVLGIGTMWNASYNLGTALAQQTGGDPRYFGRGGIAAAAGMGYTSSAFNTAGDATIENVPLENTGGSGTAGSHWRRSIFGNELMNGFAGSGNQGLSLLTLQAMSDLGYVVNTSAAETWGTYFNVSAPSAYLARYLGSPAEQIRETQLAPEIAIDAPGRYRRLTAPKQ